MNLDVIDLNKVQRSVNLLYLPRYFTISHAANASRPFAVGCHLEADPWSVHVRNCDAANSSGETADNRVF